jgi:hypothetical protein
MNREKHNSARFFIGLEVEHTPAHNMNTLFVIGVQPVEEIFEILGEGLSYLDRPYQIEHVYFGANQSFPKDIANNARIWDMWSSMIFACLNKGYWCTLDVDVDQVEGLLESGLTEHHCFIPMISVKLPYLQQLGYNATIKLDDIDFAKSNPGVWCHRLHDLIDRNKFTNWTQYTQDKVIK